MKIQGLTAAIQRAVLKTNGYVRVEVIRYSSTMEHVTSFTLKIEFPNDEKSHPGENFTEASVTVYGRVISIDPHCRTGLYNSGARRFFELLKEEGV